MSRLVLSLALIAGAVSYGKAAVVMVESSLAAKQAKMEQVLGE